MGDRLRLHTDFLLSFDTRLRNPRWVLEHISRDKLRSRQGTRQNSQFAEDAGGWVDRWLGVRQSAAGCYPAFCCLPAGLWPAHTLLLTCWPSLCMPCICMCMCRSCRAGIERRFRSKLDDYRGSGYDRGHMAPASNHKTTQDTMDETFTLSNTSPQARVELDVKQHVELLVEGCVAMWRVWQHCLLGPAAPHCCSCRWAGPSRRLRTLATRACLPRPCAPLPAAHASPPGCLGHCSLLQVGPGFNRDYWARLERFVQDLASSCDDVWVVTGPLYLPVRAAPGAGPAAAGYVMQHPMLGGRVGGRVGGWVGGFLEESLSAFAAAARLPVCKVACCLQAGHTFHRTAAASAVPCVSQARRRS